MPSWSVHLAVAKEVNKKLNLNKDLFYYGNLIPDVDKGTIINRYTAHFYDNIPFPSCPKEKMINISKFLNTYKNEHVKILDMCTGSGCFSIFFKNVVYTKCWVQDTNNKYNRNKI